MTDLLYTLRDLCCIGAITWFLAWIGGMLLFDDDQPEADHE